MTLSSWSLIATTALSIVAAPMSKRISPPDGEVRSMHLAASNGRAEFVVKVTGNVKVKDFTLANPARVILDITGAVLADDFKAKYDGVNRAGVVDVRARQSSDTSVRLVLVMDRAK